MNTNENKNFSKIIYIIVFAIILATGMFVANHPKSSEKYNDVEVSSGEASKKNSIALEDADILYDMEYGGVYVRASIPYFNALGFDYGDSVDVEFSNGYILKDIPYYNGYYTNYGDPLVVAYPGNEYIRVGLNFGEDLWTVAGLAGDEVCTIRMNEEGKYLSTQQVRDIQYSDDQGDMSDEVFANFRPINVGDLKENFVYRGASPIDNKHNRAPVVDRLIEREKIAFVIDLADDENEIAEFRSGEDFNSPYFIKLYDAGKVAALGMDAYFKSEAYSSKLVRGLTEASKNDGPYYIHCQEGKDRTGFASMIVEALAGASFNEIVEDYMKTYDNYYGITLESSEEKYTLIKNQNINEMVKYFVNDESVDLETADLRKYATDYLIRIGMDEGDINTFRNRIEK